MTYISEYNFGFFLTFNYPIKEQNVYNYERFTELILLNKN